MRPGTCGPTPASPGPSPVVTEIVVTGERQAVETRVDRKVYAVSHDLQSTLGSAADVLRNVPSVNIDLEGNPSLRGDSGVQILIDGRFAPEFNNANRGAALQQLAADGIDRIEVITNPPASFKREGTAGVINIITKRSTSPRSASARAGWGTGGRHILGTSLAANYERLNLHGSATLRRDLRIRELSARRILRDAATGTTRSERQSFAKGEDDRLSKSISFGADYELNASDRISGEGSFYRRDADGFFSENTLLLDSAGVPTNQFQRVRHSNDYEYSSGAVLSYRHAGEKDGDGISFTAQRSAGVERLPWRYVETYFLPALDQTRQDQDLDEEQVATEFSIEGIRTLASNARITAGYDLELVQGSFDVLQTFPANAGQPSAPDPDFSYLFRQEQAVHALYLRNGAIGTQCGTLCAAQPRRHHLLYDADQPNRRSDCAGQHFAGTRSTVSYEGEAALNWRAGSKSTAQINLRSSGKVLTPQGYMSGNTASTSAFAIGRGLTCR